MGDTEYGRVVDRALTVAGRGRRELGRFDPETVRKYAASWREAQAWLVSVGLSTVTPWSSETLAQYAGVLLEQGYAVPTVDGRLSAVKAEHRKRGWPVPDGVAAWYVLRGGHDTHPDAAKVNTSGLRRGQLAVAAAHLDPARPAGARDLCLATLGWDLMAPVADLVDVDLADVRTVAGDGVEAFLNVRLGDRWLPVEHLHEPVDVCPVEATQAWIGTLYQHGVTDGPLFRGVDKGGNIAGTGRYAGHRSALRLTVQGVRTIWLSIVRRGDFPADSRPRDMRMASSLEAAAAGVPLRQILERGGWSPQGRALARLVAAAEGAGQADG